MSALPTDTTSLASCTAQSRCNPLGLRYYERRAIIPAKLTRRDREANRNLLDTDNIQGDIYLMFPKNFERFVFFVVKDGCSKEFWEDLNAYRPRITNTTTTAARLDRINEDSSTVSFTSNQFALSKAGLVFLGIPDDLQDLHFDKGPMLLEKDALGDKSTWHEPFTATTHGVLIIAGKTDEECRKEEKSAREIFSRSVSFSKVLEGRVRPGDGEFFGWRDGISQPAIKELVSSVRPGQRIVDPGIIIMGHKGDPVKDDPSLVQRPSFCKDGSFMVFRKLEQDVLGFEDYVDRNWKVVPAYYGKNNSKTLTDKQRKDLFGARIVGRFKSGAPLALTPYKDDSTYTSPDLINNFDYKEGLDVDEPNRPPHCPFAAHVRKTAPRNLDPFVQKKYLDSSVMIRAGLPYGHEICTDERETWKAMSVDEKQNTKPADRGLLFVSYQSSIENGFFRQTVEFAANDFFPVTSATPTIRGLDPLIGGPPSPPTINDPAQISGEGPVIFNMTDTEGVKYVVNGFAKKVDTSARAYTPEYWITSRGGEYFFVPSISAITAWCANPPCAS